MFLSIQISYQRILDGVPQGDMSLSVSADNRMIVLDLDGGSRYRITLSVVATNEENVSDTKTTEISTVSGKYICLVIVHNYHVHSYTWFI